MTVIDPSSWLTYSEAGKLLGILPEGVRQLARRRCWPRRTKFTPTQTNRALSGVYRVPAIRPVPVDAGRERMLHQRVVKSLQGEIDAADASGHAVPQTDAPRSRQEE
jgi:hypothetical protein